MHCPIRAGLVAACLAVAATSVAMVSPTVAAPAPANCPTPTSTTRATLADVPIVGVGTTTSTIQVDGLDPYLWDVDVRTFIAHTFNVDIDVTVMSPAGTIVTLTSRNGGEHVDVFNGTVWDDDANPGGQVPYTPLQSYNPGLVTDHEYTSLVVASPLVPEESLAAFNGENPNGTWTLTVNDPSTNFSGRLLGWSVRLETLPAAVRSSATTYTQSTPISIPGVISTITSTIEVTGSTEFALADVDVQTFMTHTYPSDLDVTLRSPAGTIVTLTSGNGGDPDNVFNGTVWDDDANAGGQVPYTPLSSYNAGLVTDHQYTNLVVASRLVPEESLGAFNGENPNGTWTLTVHDSEVLDGGNLSKWSITTRGIRCAPGAPRAVAARAANKSAVVTWSPPSGTVGAPITSYTATATPGGARCSGTSKCTITGLKNGTTYTVTVKATNGLIAGAASASRSVTPRATPGAPRAVAALAGAGRLTVLWRPPSSNGGAPITSYTATATPGGRSCTVKATNGTTCSITKLRNGTAYTVTVKAKNAAGAGKASKKSRPTAPNSAN